MKLKRNLLSSYLSTGQSLVETIVAVGMISLILVALVSAVTFAIGNAQFAKNKSQATKYAQEVSEWLRSERDTSWPTFANRAPVAGSIYCLNNLSWPSGVGACSSGTVIPATIFTRNVTLTGNAASDRVTVDIVISWTQGNRNSNVTIDTYLTKWQ